MAFAMQTHPWWRWASQVGRLRGEKAAPLTMTELRYGYLPARFRYAGNQHRVRRVERSWEERAPASRALRRCFLVQCTTGRRFTIAQDLRVGNWQLLE